MRSMPSTSRVTWSLRTSATDRGRVMVGSGRHDPSGSTNRFAVKIGDASAYPVIGTTGAISLLHLVGLRRSLVSHRHNDGSVDDVVGELFDESLGLLDEFPIDRLSTVPV